MMRDTILMTKLPPILALLAFLPILYSCTEVKFSTSQPREIDKLDLFPGQLRGIYVNQEGDTLTIGDVDISLVNRKSNCMPLDEKDSLSPSVVLKYFAGYYFLSILEDSLWSSILVTIDRENRLVVSMIDAEDEANLQNLALLTTLDTLFTAEGEIIHYLADPDTGSLLRMVDHGIFDDPYYFERITAQKR